MIAVELITGRQFALNQPADNVNDMLALLRRTRAEEMITLQTEHGTEYVRAGAIIAVRRYAPGT
jgi:hypothetical protein